MEYFADIEGIKLHYTVSGNPDGKPVVLMHGWGCNISTVASIETALKDGLKVISLDLPGHGKSSEPPLLPDGKPWGAQEHADCIISFLDSINVENPSIIGHSHGGRIGIAVAAKKNIEKLVLVDAAGIRNPLPLKKRLRIQLYKKIRSLLHHIAGKKITESFVRAHTKRYGSKDYQNSSAVMKGVMSRCVNEDLRNLLPEIKAPTLLIWGEQDTATPLSDALLMEKMIPDAGLVTIKGAGHYSFLDNPRLFSSVLRSFFCLS